ncbi:ATP-grasp domain-containing protein [Nocardioides campestrisoli]|uniref:ATP-grasp domain-containing protein n=1 Tax=Nocardioides campestrisoli TaxID=2736757 RepID=UPI0015E6C8FF|nr:hypothetical protein [Nocardioides campestrisoli]
MTDVLLATFTLMPDGEPGGERLLAALADRGVTARWVRWDDPAVDWAAADLVVVRSTWDYQRRCAEFLAWTRRVAAVTPLLNDADTIAWNADKSYLLPLGELVPVVPTELLDDATLVEGLESATERWGTVVIKPRTGAGGVGVVLAGSVADERLEGLTAAPWVVQPLVESVRTTGESSVYVFAGVAATQVDKVAGGEEIRVHELYGGSSRPVPLDADRGALAEKAVRAAGDLLGTEPAYARVDMMLLADAWVVSELELIEPGLYLDLVPANAERFADVVTGRLRSAARG